MSDRYIDKDGNEMRWGNAWCDRHCAPPLESYGDGRCPRCGQGPFRIVDSSALPKRKAKA